jgi:N-acetylglucosamine repressor
MYYPFLMQKATRQHTKEHNRNLVLKTIFEHESISRAEIARLTRLTRTTVSDIVADLLAANLVSEIGIGSSLGGKSPILLSLLDDSRYLIGVDLAYNQFSGAVVNLRGRIRQMVSMPVNFRNRDESLTTVYKIIDQLMEAACQPMIGIGVGTPGLVDTSEGVVINAVNLDWKNLPLARLLKERYHLPIYILNDSQAAAIGEYTYGQGHEADSNLIVINVRQGIGSGIVINGHIFQGDGGAAGEIGHIVVVPEGGALCRCGNYGCLETVASTQAIVERAQLLAQNNPDTQLSLASQEIDLDTIEMAFKAGDPLARQVVLDAGRYMGLAISILVETLNIHKIVLSGVMTCFGEPWVEAMRESLSRTTLARLAQDTVVEIGQLGGNGVILGSSAILANDYALLINRQPTHDQAL